MYNEVFCFYTLAHIDYAFTLSIIFAVFFFLSIDYFYRKGLTISRCFSEAAAPFVASNHPRRSVLYMPGSNARAMEKGKTIPADGLILDLEDAVAINMKVIAFIVCMIF